MLKKKGLIFFFKYIKLEHILFVNKINETYLVDNNLILFRKS